MKYSQIVVIGQSRYSIIKYITYVFLLSNVGLHTMKQNKQNYIQLEKMYNGSSSLL